MFIPSSDAADAPVATTRANNASTDVTSERMLASMVRTEYFGYHPGAGSFEPGHPRCYPLAHHECTPPRGARPWIDDRGRRGCHAGADVAEILAGHLSQRRSSDPPEELPELPSSRPDRADVAA